MLTLLNQKSYPIARQRWGYLDSRLRVCLIFIFHYYFFFFLAWFSQSLQELNQLAALLTLFVFGSTIEWQETNRNIKLGSSERLSSLGQDTMWAFFNLVQYVAWGWNKSGGFSDIVANLQRRECGKSSLSLAPPAQCSRMCKICILFEQVFKNVHGTPAFKQPILTLDTDSHVATGCSANIIFRGYQAIGDLDLILNLTLTVTRCTWSIFCPPTTAPPACSREPSPSIPSRVQQSPHPRNCRSWCSNDDLGLAGKTLIGFQCRRNSDFAVGRAGFENATDSLP